MLKHHRLFVRSSFRVALVGGALSVAQSVFAQQAVQLPVVDTTSVNTSVSVPDRGSTFIGGVSSAASGRNQYGPIRPGTSSGLERQASSMSVNVYMHDFQAMDEALLNSGANKSHPSDFATGRRLNSISKQDLPAVAEASPAEKVAKFEQLAKRAEEVGKHAVAKLHWKAAAKYGSKLAETRLAELKQQSSTPGIPTSLPTTAAR